MGTVKATKKRKIKENKERRKKNKRDPATDEGRNKLGEINEESPPLKKNKKQKKVEKHGTDDDITNPSQISLEANSGGGANKKKDKFRKKRKSKQDVDAPPDEPCVANAEEGSCQHNGNGVQGESYLGGTRKSEAADDATKTRSCKSKKPRKKKKMDPNSSNQNPKLPVNVTEHGGDEVYQISSGDEDSSRGMKKWLTGYHNSRPGLTVLQEKIDDFIMAHEERLEQERKEREAKASEGGWTVVVHHKGRKKTTDSETGITVGSVAPAAAEDRMSKKKHKEVVAPDFYRFQKREAHRKEIMMLRSKFEEDKKRIQQLRAARKFKPY